MRKDFDLTSRKAVAITIGAMKDEESFFALLGTVVATAILGKIPSREDRASFMGTSETKLAKLIRDQVEFAYYERGDLKAWFNGYTVGCPSVNSAIYALATQIVAQGFYAGEAPEPITRRVAREFLNRYFQPQMIQTANAFLGYQMVLEYLWWNIDHTNIMEFSKFVKMRYDYTPKKAQDFCDAIADFMGEKQDTESSLTEKGKYATVIHGLICQLIAEGEIKGEPEV